MTSSKLTKENTPVFCLTGPTATGKSDLAIALSQQLPIEIISVDSAMIYRHMNIGTAKPSLSIRQSIPHHLIDIREPYEVYSAGDFHHDVTIIINDIISRNRVPLLVGGTMMYFNILRQGLANLPTANQQIRQKIIEEAQQYGWPHVHQQLTQVDPEAAKKIHPNDPQRLQRALEVYRISGKPISIFHLSQQTIDKNSEQCNSKTSLNLNFIAVLPKDRTKLHQRIETRFNEMLAQGLLNEVSALYQCTKLDSTMPSMKTVGYRQASQYLSHSIDYQLMVERSIIATRQLAKRQMTWLRSWHDVRRYYMEDKQLTDKILNVMLKKLSTDIA